MQYAPVCGSNGQTYSNSCVARCRGIAVASSGECGSRSGGGGSGGGWSQQEQGPRPGSGSGSSGANGWFSRPSFFMPPSGGSRWGSSLRPNRLAAHKPAEVVAAAAVAEQQAVPIQAQGKQQQQQQQQQRGTVQQLDQEQDKAKQAKQRESGAGEVNGAAGADTSTPSGPPPSWMLAPKGDCGCPPVHEPVCVGGVTFASACVAACGRRRAATAYSGPCVEHAGLAAAARPASSAAGGQGSSRWRGSWLCLVLVLVVQLHTWQAVP